MSPSSSAVVMLPVASPSLPSTTSPKGVPVITTLVTGGHPGAFGSAAQLPGVLPGRLERLTACLPGRKNQRTQSVRPVLWRRVLRRRRGTSFPLLDELSGVTLGVGGPEVKLRQFPRSSAQAPNITSHSWTRPTMRPVSMRAATTSGRLSPARPRRASDGTLARVGQSPPSRGMSPY